MTLPPQCAILNPMSLEKTKPQHEGNPHPTTPAVTFGLSSCHSQAARIVVALVVTGTSFDQIAEKEQLLSIHCPSFFISPGERPLQPKRQAKQSHHKRVHHKHEFTTNTSPPQTRVCCKTAPGLTRKNSVWLGMAPQRGNALFGECGECDIFCRVLTLFCHFGTAGTCLGMFHKALDSFRNIFPFFI